MPTRREFMKLGAALLWLAVTAWSQTKSVAPLLAPETRVDINHASLDELLKVPGMTRSWAGRIIRYRPYRAKSDLVEHGVVTSEFYARIKDSIIAHRGEQ